MARFASFAKFRTHQRSLRRTEPENPKLEETAAKVESTRTSERSPEAERLKSDLDARTEAVKATSKDGTADDLLERTSDRRLIEEARTKAPSMEPEDRVEVELAITRTADVDLRAGASMLGRTTDTETTAKLESMTRTAADDIRTATTNVREIAPTTELPAEVAVVAETAGATTETISAQVTELATMESPPLAEVGGADAAMSGIDMSRSRAGDQADDDAPDPVSVEFDPDAFDLGSGSSGPDHREVLDDAIDGAEARADALETAQQQADAQAALSDTAVTTSGALIDAHMSTLEVLSMETGAPAADGIDVDYVLNDTSMRAVLNGISDEAQAKVDHEVAMERAKLAELRADTARDVADGLSDALDDSALVDGPATQTPNMPGLDPYASQVDAFSARAQVAAAEYEETASMRDAFVGYEADLTVDVSVLEARLEAARAMYSANQELTLERLAPPSGVTLDLTDHRLDRATFDGAVDALRDMSTVQAELAAKRAVLADVRAELEVLDERVDDAEDDLERAEARLDDAQERLDDAIEAATTGGDLPDFDPDAVARADLEELQDDIDDLEAQLEEIDQDAATASIDASVAEGMAAADAALAGGLAAGDFSLSHVETEFQIIPAPPGVVPVTQYDEGVNDPVLRSALDAIEGDLQGRAEAAQARFESDLIEQRQDEMEALLDELREQEAELADEVPPLPDPPADEDSNDDDPDDGGPLVTDLDPDADLDLAANAGASDAVAVDSIPTATVDSIDQIPTEPEATQAPLDPEATPEAPPAPAPAEAISIDSGPSTTPVAEPTPDLAFGGGAATVDEVVSVEAAAEAEPPPPATEPLAMEMAIAEPAVQAEVETAEPAQMDPVEMASTPAEAEPIEPVATEAVSMDRADLADDDFGLD